MSEFRPIPGYKGHYEASRDGVLRSVARTIMRADGKPLRVPARVLSTTVSNRGYERASMVRDGKARRIGVHQAVAAAWLPAPPGPIGTKHGSQYVVNHKDGNKANNHADNLEYVTSRENVAHARRTGLLSAKGILNHKARLTEDDVRAVRVAYAGGETQVSLAARYGVSQTTISRVVLRKTWSHVARVGHLIGPRSSQTACVAADGTHPR